MKIKWQLTVSIYNFLEDKMFGQMAMIGVFQFYSYDSICDHLLEFQKKKKKNWSWSCKVGGIKNKGEFGLAF